MSDAKPTGPTPVPGPRTTPGVVPRPRSFSAAALAAGLLAAVVAGGEELGLGTVTVALAVALAVRLSGRAPSGAWPLAWTGIALGLAAIAFLRDARWVVVPALVAAVALGSLAMAGGATWSRVLRGLAAAPAALPMGVLPVARAAAATTPNGVRARLTPVLRGVALSVVLLAVFGGLLASGDPAFAEIAGEALPTAWDLTGLPSRVAWFAATVAVAGALVLAADLGRAAPVIGPPRRRLGMTEWGIALGALDLLFAAFVAVQAAVLFGRHDYVLATAGLTYAEYARQGFGQLLLAATLTVAVVGAALRWSRAVTPWQRRVLRALLAVLCALTLVVLLSAMRRLGLYEEAFGATRLRVLAGATMLWLGAVIGLVLTALLGGRHGWLPRASVALSGLALLAFAWSDPDRRIAERNVERFGVTGRVDVGYLSALSADAVPALTALPRPLRDAALAPQRRALAEEEGWADTNLARTRARAALDSLE